MRKIQLPLAALVLLLGLARCNSSPKGMPGERYLESEYGILYGKDIRMDREDQVQGIRLEYHFDKKQDFHASAENMSFAPFVKVEDENGNPVTIGMQWQNRMRNQQFYQLDAAKSYLSDEFPIGFLPFFLLDLPPGKHNLRLKTGIWEAREREIPDSASVQRNYWNEPIKVLAETSTPIDVFIPEKKALQILVNYFRLDSSQFDPEAMDWPYHMRSSWPDPMWTLTYGNLRMFNSSFEGRGRGLIKESLVWQSDLASPPMYVLENDFLTLSVYDYDAIGSHDHLGSFTFDPFHDLQEKDLAHVTEFGWVFNFRYHVFESDSLPQGWPDPNRLF